MKLNYKRTILVGFAFFLICAFWQAYDNTIPLILTNKFGMSQTWSGIIMAADNVLALFLLPFFGALSDRTSTKIGRRMQNWLSMAQDPTWPSWKLRRAARRSRHEA